MQIVLAALFFLGLITATFYISNKYNKLYLSAFCIAFLLAYIPIFVSFYIFKEVKYGLIIIFIMIFYFSINFIRLANKNNIPHVKKIVKFISILPIILLFFQYRGLREYDESYWALIAKKVWMGELDEYASKYYTIKTLLWGALNSYSVEFNEGLGSFIEFTFVVIVLIMVLNLYKLKSLYSVLLILMLMYTFTPQEYFLSSYSDSGVAVLALTFYVLFGKFINGEVQLFELIAPIFLLYLYKFSGLYILILILISYGVSYFIFGIYKAFKEKNWRYLLLNLLVLLLITYGIEVFTYNIKDLNNISNKLSVIQPLYNYLNTVNYFEIIFGFFRTLINLFNIKNSGYYTVGLYLFLVNWILILIMSLKNNKFIINTINLSVLFIIGVLYISIYSDVYTSPLVGNSINRYFYQLMLVIFFESFYITFQIIDLSKIRISNKIKLISLIGLILFQLRFDVNRLVDFNIINTHNSIRSLIKDCVDSDDTYIQFLDQNGNGQNAAYASFVLYPRIMLGSSCIGLEGGNCNKSIVTKSDWIYYMHLFGIEKVIIFSKNDYLAKLLDKERGVCLYLKDI